MSENFKYDAFIAYGSPDAAYAQKLYAVLSAVGSSVFLDSENLLAGDPWLDKLGQAQKDSLLTVILISSHSSSAYFQREEILRAIELARNARHRVVPVYLGGRRAREGDIVPLPLKQLHGIFWDEESALLSVAQKIKVALETSKRHQEWQHDIDPATVVIVTGCHHMPELYDRPSAYELKRSIDDLAHSLRKPFLSSVVIGDIWLQKFSGIADHHNLISIGSPGVNSLTGQIAEQSDTIRTGPDDRWQIKRALNRWALFGNRAEDTHDAVTSFKKYDLSVFLQEVWSSQV